MRKRDTAADQCAVTQVMKKRRWMVAGTVVLIIWSILVAVLLVAVGPKASTKRFMHAYLDADAEKAFYLAFPDAVLEKEYGVDGALERAIQTAGEELRARFETLREQDPNWSARFEIEKTEKVTGERLQTIRDLYHKEYQLQVAAAKVMTVTVVFTVKGETITKEAEMVAMRIGVRWYVDLAHSNLNLIG